MTQLHSNTVWRQCEQISANSLLFVQILPLLGFLGFEFTMVEL